ncbi:MAG: periplasmic heavy metal sensor [Nitrospira sp.]|nr:periplasmic heavy metal sensor [Nitrospira sp.]
MKKLLKAALLAVLISGLTAATSIAQDKDIMKRGVGPANFFISMKDKIGMSKEQEEKLIAIEKAAIKKMEEVSPAMANAQQTLNNLTKDDEIDLNKAKELLKSISSLESEARFIFIETMVLEKKVLTKEQRDKVNTIAQEMSKGMQPPAPVKK